MHGYPDDFYDDGLPPWRQPGIEDWGPESLDDLDDDGAPGAGPEPVVIGYADIMVIGSPVPNSWGGRRA